MKSRLRALRIGNVEIPNNVFMAPMAGITDLPFREIVCSFGAGLVYTEMVSAKGMHYNNKATGELLDVGSGFNAVQLFGSEPDILAEAARNLDRVERITLIDINMGCPAPKIVKNGEGSALMRDEALIGRIVRAVSSATSKPVTVKIRKGFGGSNNAVEVAKIAEQNGAKAVTIHGRTREQYYSGNADWEVITRVKQAVSIPVIGNGDVFSPEAAAQMLHETGCDGIMIARGAQGNPWLFSRTIDYLKRADVHCAPLQEPTDEERINAAIFHAQRLVEYKGEFIGIREARKHMCWYIKGLRGAPAAKVLINHAETLEEMRYILTTLLNKG